MKTLILAVMAFGLTLGLAGMASAATITCGQCHGAYINNPDGTKTVMSGVQAWEDLKTPQAGDICNQNGRGLHGIHMNYSSVSFGRWNRYKNTTTSTRGTCDYCHNKHNHENGYVEFSGVSVTTPTQKAISAGLRVSGTGFGPNGLDITQMNGNATCTTACHKGTTATNTATWGNYTSASTSLSCATCHMDSSNINTISTTDGVTINGYVAGYTLSSPPHVATTYDPAKLKGHATHLLGDWLGTGANKTIIVMGNYSGPLNMTDDSSCQLCHPDNRNDRYSQGRADDGSKKAYPHAKDGTIVNVFNANINGQAGVTLTNRTGLGTNPTCTSLCHTNKSAYQIANPTWGDTWASGTGGHCDMCHNHQPSAGINQSATVPLQYAHALHFQNISTMLGRKASCNDCHPSAHTNYAGLAMITKLPVAPGNAGLLGTLGWTGTGRAVNGTCQNSCHKYSPSPAWNTIATNVVTGTAGCSACHQYPGSPNEWDLVAKSNGHTVRAKFLQNATTAVSRQSLAHLNNASAYNYLTDTYAGVTGDQSLCGKCHSGATAKHMDGTIEINPTNGLGTNCSTNFTFNNISTGSKVTCSNAKCHFGKTTPNWW